MLSVMETYKFTVMRRNKMPYINTKREEYNKIVDTLSDEWADNGKDYGHLNYIITRLFHKVILHEGLRYKTAVFLFGTLVCVGLELYRVVFGKYEDIKKKENGSISELDRNSNV